MKKLSLPLIVLAFGYVGPVLADDPGKIHSETNVEQNADGSYKGTSKYEATDSNGTKTNSEVTQKETVTKDGVKSAYSKTTSNDPKGLGNESWSEKEGFVNKDAKGNLEAKGSASSVDKAGTAHEASEEVKARMKSDGTVETTTTSKKVTDPKGLLNKHTIESETTVEKRPDGTTETTAERKVN